ncbi:hypothetical protein GCM10023324_59820 [Streptomyces youssoufiensis]
MLVLGLDALPSALAAELLQYAWPHCGKIGRYVSHRARSLTHSEGDADRSHECVVLGTGGKDSEFRHGSQADARGSSRCPQGVYKCAMRRRIVLWRPGIRWWWSDAPRLV